MKQEERPPIVVRVTQGRRVPPRSPQVAEFLRKLSIELREEQARTDAEVRRATERRGLFGSSTSTS